MRGHSFLMCMHQLRIKGMTDESSFYEELERVFDHLPLDHNKIKLGEFNAILGREDLYKPTFRNES